VYFTEICLCALKETTRIWTPQRTWIAFASPVVTVPIRGIFYTWSMHDLFVTACITELQELQRRNCSQTTVTSYIKIVADFAKYLQRPPDQLGADDIRAHQLHLVHERKQGVRTVGTQTAALRFFFCKTLERNYCGGAGLGPDSAQQIIAEIGPKAEAFPSAAQLASWVGVCPGRQESAGESNSDRSAKGNRTMRRLPESACPRICKKERLPSAAGLSKADASNGVCKGNLGDCPSSLSTDLESSS